MIFALAIAVSFDSLALGATYGLNNIKIPFLSKLILSIVSGLSLSIAMLLGVVFKTRLTPEITNYLGSFIFICLGLFNLWRSYYDRKKEGLVCSLRIPFLGLIIQILKEPLKADYDLSQHISKSEALILGIALALDAFAAGFAAALLSLPLLLTASAVMLTSFLLLSLGLILGEQLTIHNPQIDLRWLPGFVITLIGILKLFS